MGGCCPPRMPSWLGLVIPFFFRGSASPTIRSSPRSVSDRSCVGQAVGTATCLMDVLRGKSCKVLVCFDLLAKRKVRTESTKRPKKHVPITKWF